MCIEAPFLRYACLGVPGDEPVRAGFDEVTAAARLDRIDDYDAVRSLVDRAIGRRTHTRSVVTLIAHLRDVGDVHHGVVASSSAFDADPVRAGVWHGFGVT